MEQWKQDRLIDILDTLIDYRGKTPNKVERGIPLITAKIVKNGRIETPTEFLPAEEYRDWMVRGKEIIEKQKGESVSTELYISKSRYDEIKNKFGVPKEGDMLLTSVGTLGIPYIVKNETFYFKDGNLTWFTDFKEINSKFLYYWFLSPIAKNAINAKAIGSTQKALTIDALSKFEIDIPNIDTQNRIVSILSSLDSKIELNRRINDNLIKSVA